MLYDRISKLCEEHGTNICTLEKTIRIGNGTIGRWTHATPRLDTIKKVADYFGVTIDSLLHGKE